MRIKSVFALFALFLVGNIGGDGATTIRNSIQSVYENLAIVTRITNAIFLQSAAIKHSVKVREVIAELLGVNTKSFSELVEENPGALFEGLKVLYNKSRKVDFSKFEKLKNGKESLESLRTRFEQLEASVKLDEVTVGKFFDKMFDDKFREDVLGCKLEDVKEIAKIKDFKNQTLKTMIFDCLEKLKNVEKVSESINADFKLLNEIEKRIDEISTDLQLPEKTLIEEILDAFKDSFPEAQKIWSRTNNQLKHFVVAISQIAKISKIAVADLNFTIGFPDFHDFLKVRKDLGSFEKLNLVENLNASKIMELEESLAGFFKFSEKTKDIGGRWDTFINNFKLNRVLAISTAQRIGRLEKFSVENGAELILDSRTLLSKCYNGRVVVINIFTDVGNKFYDIMLGAQRSTLKNATLGILEMQEMSKTILKDLDQTALKSEKLEEIATLVDLFSKLRKSQEFLAKQFNDLKVKTHLKDAFLSTIQRVKNSVNRTAFGCLKTSNFGTTDLLNIGNFLKDVHIIRNASEFGKVSGILDEYLGMRKILVSTEDYVKNISRRQKRSSGNDSDSDSDQNLVLKLENPREKLISIGRGMLVLRDMHQGLSLRRELLATLQFPDDVNIRIQEHNSDAEVKKFWKDPKPKILKLLEDLQTLEDFARKINASDFKASKSILEESIKVQGFPETFKHILRQFSTNPDSQVFKVSREISELDLDFAAHKGYLHAASLSFEEIQQYFEEEFQNKETDTAKVEHNYLAAILICISIVILLIIGGILIFGFTKTGKSKFRNFYFYYFQKTEEFEKRWRYSLFLDRVDMKNGLVDAVREINSTNVLKAVKKGAYINVFSNFGNSPLHVATKKGYPEIVEILIRHGADRTLLNVQNKVPEKMIPVDYRKTHSDRIEKYEQIEKIYEKYRNRKFRIWLPEIFPVSSFHIFIEERTEDTTTNKFMDNFQSITSDEALPTTTHLIVKTDSVGIFETDKLDLLCWIFNGVIVVKETWMNDCLADHSKIAEDFNYLVEKVKFRGVVYDTVIQWTTAMAKGTPPYLYGVQVVIVINDCPNLVALSTIIVNLGGRYLNELPEKERYNVGSHPYLHSHLGPVFIIHDGQTNLTEYQKDPDRLFTLFTEEEFIHFLLKRDIRVDQRQPPIPVTNEVDD